MCALCKSVPSPVAQQWEKVPDRGDEGLCPRVRSLTSCRAVPALIRPVGHLLPSAKPTGEGTGGSTAPSPLPLPHHEPPQASAHHRVDDDADEDQLAEVGVPDAAEELHNVPRAWNIPSKPSSRRRPGSSFLTSHAEPKRGPGLRRGDGSGWGWCARFGVARSFPWFPSPARRMGEGGATKTDEGLFQPGRLADRGPHPPSGTFSHCFATGDGNCGQAAATVILASCQRRLAFRFLSACAGAKREPSLRWGDAILGAAPQNGAASVLRNISASALVRRSAVRWGWAARKRSTMRRPSE